MINPIQQSEIKKKKKLVIAGSIAVGALWLMVAFYALSLSKESQLPLGPRQVAVHPASPTGGGSPVATYKGNSHFGSSSLFHHGGSAVSAPAYHSSSNHASSMGSTSMRLHETSDASVHSIGGGRGGANVGGGNSSQRGIHSTALAYTGAIYMPTNIAITAVGATSAQEMATLVTPQSDGANNGPNRVGPLPPGPFPDPIGDVTWGWMLLLTIGWCVRVHRKRQQACK